MKSLWRNGCSHGCSVVTQIKRHRGLAQVTTCTCRCRAWVCWCFMPCWAPGGPSLLLSARCIPFHFLPGWQTWLSFYTLFHTCDGGWPEHLPSWSVRQEIFLACLPAARKNFLLWSSMLNILEVFLKLLRAVCLIDPALPSFRSFIQVEGGCC